MRFLMGMTAGLALLATPVLAADAAGSRAAAKTDPLKPGKSAGIHAAQQARAGLALVSAGAIIAIVVVAASASNGNGSGNNNQPNSQSVTTTP
jgi:hypothetical protein